MSRFRLPIVVFLLVLVPLLGWGMNLWMAPKYPSRVQGEDIVPPDLPLETPVLHRKAYSRAVAESVRNLNLFRQERRPYQKPKKPVNTARLEAQKKLEEEKKKKAAIIPPQPTVPPPKLRLTGVVLQGDFGVAFFDGTYSELRSGKVVNDLEPRKKGYKVGEYLGAYQVQDIGKDRVVLQNSQGYRVTLRLLRTPPSGTVSQNTSKRTQRPVLKRHTSIKKRTITPRSILWPPAAWAPSRIVPQRAALAGGRV